MRGSLLFVHGTGVRAADMNATFTRIRDGARKAGIDEGDGISGVRFATCAWGDTFGVTPGNIPDILPPARTRAAAGEATAAELELALWAVLLEDPLFELRVGAQKEAPERAAISFGGPTPDAAAVAALQGLDASALPLAGTGLAPAALKAAATTIAASPLLAQAALTAGSPNNVELLDAIGRAVVAQSILAAQGPAPAIAFDAAVRDATVAAVALALQAATGRGPRDWIGDRAKDLARNVVTWKLRRDREQITEGALPGVGDILLYQRRGAAILDFIAAALEQLPPPVVALGHSLGGIMLVDLLSRANHPRVDRLVTVGSQSPLFYIVDSLSSLEPGKPAQPFTPWLNLFDRNDFLSYVAEGVFPRPANGPTPPEIEDYEIDSGVPFPNSHSAYFSQDETFAIVRDRWPAP
ncbi:MAG: hypothetical protein HYX53_16245 [Chloroflexi bacterium]|nr:hypothetical protein [Chloroflexota bacterium]